jgi:hypothetical protein
MKVALILLLLTAVAGCRDKQFSEIDDRVLCDERGKAYLVIPWVGDTSFVKAVRDGEAVCTARLKVTP